MITVQGPFRNGILRAANAVLSAVLSPAKAPPRPQGPRVLVIRCDHLGDATLATAPLQAIRDTLVPSRMDVVCGPWASAIFEGHPAVDEILTVAAPWWLLRERVGLMGRLRAWVELARFVMLIRKRRYDVGIDLRGDLRHFMAFFVMGGIPERVSSDRTGGAVLLTSCAEFREDVHEVDRMFAIVGTIGVPHRGQPVIVRRPLSAARRQALGLPPRFVAVTPRGASPNRQWPPEHVAELSRLVSDQLEMPLVYLGSDADRAHAEAVGRGGAENFVNLAGQTTIPELIGVLEEAELVVAMDSGPMHLAAALGRRVVALWGPGPLEMQPRTRLASIVEPPTPCVCGGAGGRCLETNGGGRCYRELSASRVFAAVEQNARTTDANLSPLV